MLRSAVESLGPTSRVFRAARAVRRSPDTAYWTWISMLPLESRRRALYRRYHGRELRLDPPSLFSEKVNWRIVHDRRDVLAWTCDKLRMKEYAETFQGLHVPRTLWQGTDVTELADVDLPERWVLKPNHRSGVVHFGHGQPIPADLRRATTGWMRDMQTVRLGEWAYSQARPMFLAEEWIGEGDADPVDYKFFVFGGEPAVVNVHTDRFAAGGHGRRFYHPDWTFAGTGEGVPTGPDTPRPPVLEEMLHHAGRLGAQFDFMRIDLYWTHGRISFGETTPYPAGGLRRFVPTSLDHDLGARWNLPAIDV